MANDQYSGGLIRVPMHLEIEGGFFRLLLSGGFLEILFCHYIIDRGIGRIASSMRLR